LGGRIKIVFHFDHRSIGVNDTEIDNRIYFDGDIITELFSETYGRFLVAFQNESILSGIPHRIIGESGGSAMVIEGKKKNFRFQLMN
jgi:hypothetical protein